MMQLLKVIASDLFKLFCLLHTLVFVILGYGFLVEVAQSDFFVYKLIILPAIIFICYYGMSDFKLINMLHDEKGEWQGCKAIKQIMIKSSKS